MSWLIPRNNPYWNKNIGREVAFERKEKLIDLMLPTREDWELLERMEEATSTEATKPMESKE